MESPLCALCSKTTVCDDFQQFDSLKCDMLQVIHPELTFTSTDDLYICKDCEGKLSKFFSFKNCCLEIDDSLRTFLNHENKVNLDVALHRLKGKGFDNEQGVNQICRLCLDTIADSSTLGAQADVRVMMKACLPEVDLQITDQSTFCNVCLQHLTEQFNFIQSLTNLEEKLSKSRAYSISNKNSCDLFQNKTTCEPIGDIVYEIDTDDGDDSASKDISCNITQAEIDVEQVTININMESCIQVSDDDEGAKAKEGEIYYNCTECNFKSKVDYSLKLHLLLSHSDVKKFVSTKKLDGIITYLCNACHFETNKDYHIWSHVITHEMFKPFKCKYKAGYRNVEYKTHKCRLQKRKLESLEDNGRNNKKIQNGTTTKGLTVITEQKDKPKKRKKRAINKPNKTVLGEEGEYYECSKCQYKSKNNYSFKLHSLLTHSDVDSLISTKTSNGKKMFICNYCGFEADRDYNIWSHVIIHTESKSFRKPYRCKSCSYRSSFLSPKLHSCKNNVKDRMKNRSEPGSLFRCTLCSVKSDKLNSIRKHLRVHLAINSKIHSCKNCKFKTNCKNIFRQHVNQEDDLSGEEREVTDVPQFNCQFCHFQGTEEKQFMKHVEQHSEKEVYIEFLKTVRIPKMTEVQLGPAEDAI